MPWDERTEMDQRLRFIGALRSGLYTMTELCREYGISRKTGYKWWLRYFEGGLDGLKNQPRAPQSCPHRTAKRCEQLVVEKRLQHPDWGARKLLDVLGRRYPELPWPAESTGGEILKRHGLIRSRPRRRPRRRPASRPLVVAPEPNDVWTTDYKGEFRLGDRSLCYPLTIADHRSRFLLGCQGKRSVALQGTRSLFERVFDEYGLPSKILSDNGTPFAAPCSPRRLSRLSVWWIRLGIEPVLIQPGHPEQNARHERMHRTLKARTARPPAACMRSQQRSFDDFRREFNHDRPHEGLDMKRPAEVYTPSNRPYPRKTPDVEYPGHYEVRRVRRNGEIKWRGSLLFTSLALVGEHVGLQETDDGIWSLHFGPYLLGRYRESDQHLDLL